MKHSAQIALLAMLGTSMAIAGYSTDGVAQAVNIQPGSNPELRVAYATPQDIAEGKRVAETMCVKCHNLNGISTSKGVPHIAGQRPVYLHQELKVYQTGARGVNAMSDTVKYMNDDALMKVAAYYASLEPADVSVPSGKAAPAKPDPVAAGRGAAAGCAGCHGDSGVSKTPGMPNLVGLDPKYFTAAINAYKGGQRKHDMMKTLVSGLSETDLGNVALFFALQQKPGKAQTPAPGNVAAGKTAAAGCVGCHGEGGVSGNPSTPSLAGQDAQYFIAAMRAYKDGSRNDATMKGVAGSVDEPVVKDLAAYYAGQQPQRPNVAKPMTAAEWAQRCDRCHGVNGNSTDPRSPALAAQRVDYLEKVLRAYKKGERKSKEMAVMSEGLDDALVDGLALHYARQKARGAVYVILPPAAK
jgi:cytochrome c553